MWWWKKRGAAAATATNPQDRDSVSAVPDYGAPQEDLAALGPVVRQNHIAYVPAGFWSRVPGTGTGNLVYAPDFLLSPPNYFGGNAMLRRPNSIAIALPPAVITQPYTTLEGVGGLVAGQVIHQPLLAVEIDSSKSEVGE